MTELLSQDEIDSLLNAISTTGGQPSGAMPQGTASSKTVIDKQRKIKPYDFKRPDKFSKDQIRTLQMMHETFARLTTTSLSAHLRTMVHVHVASVDQLTYEEFMKSIPNPTTIAVASMSPLEGSCVLEVDPSISFTIIDRLFGGKGWAANLQREMTDIELAVMERIIARVLSNLAEAWENVINLQTKLEKIESNPQFIQIVPPNDMVVLITLETKVGEVEGMINFCIPYITLEPIITKLSAQYWYASVRRGSTKESLKKLKSKLSFIGVPVTVEVGSVKVKAKDILNLEKGDVLKLSQTVKTPLKINVNNKLKFYGRAGRKGSKKAVQITKIADEEFKAESEQ